MSNNVEAAQRIAELSALEAQTPEQASVERDPVVEHDAEYGDVRGAPVGVVLENGGGTTVRNVSGKGLRLPGRRFWMRPGAVHILSKTIKAGTPIFVWTATSAQPLVAGMGPAPKPEILHHMLGPVPPALFDEGMRENHEPAGFVFEQWMAWAGVVALLVIGAAVLAYLYWHKRGVL